MDSNTKSEIGEYGLTFERYLLFRNKIHWMIICPICAVPLSPCKSQDMFVVCGVTAMFALVYSDNNRCKITLSISLFVFMSTLQQYPA